MTTASQQYWLWVTRPEFYLENGREREDLDPKQTPDAEDWWTCHEDTKTGDLVLLYRTAPRSDIAYFIRVTGDPIVLEEEYQLAYGWPYKCGFQVLYKFESPIKLAQMQNDPYLEQWPALRGRFQKSAWSIDPSSWSELITIASKNNPKFAEFFQNLEDQPTFRRSQNEKYLEDQIAANLSVLSRFGFNLQLRDRQYQCSPVGRMDLLCYDEQKRCHVVIELKDVKATPSTYAQISSYMGWVQTHLANDEGIIGLVISRGFDVRFDACLKAPNVQIQQIDVELLAL